MITKWLRRLLAEGDDAEVQQDEEQDRKAQWRAHAAENRTKAILAARAMTAQLPVIFDAETTGLDKTDQVIEIACVDIEGKVLLETLVKPTCRVSDGARAIHRISDDQLADAPLIDEVAPLIQAEVSDRLILGWNFKFDSRLLRQSLRARGLTWSKEWKDFRGPESEHCIMYWYGRFAAGTSRRRIALNKALEQSGIRTPGPSHRALADAQAARLVLKHMAAASE